MLYDLFTDNKHLADIAVALVNKPWLYDDTAEGDNQEIYQILDIPEQKMKLLKSLIKHYPDGFDIRDSVTNNQIWPHPRGLTLEQALDLV